jgi:DUF4097 and DUF4098 domain-containing protein YvlB
MLPKPFSPPPHPSSGFLVENASMRMFIGLILAVACGNAFAWQECRYSADRNLDIDPAGLKTLQLVLGSNDAHVEGVSGSKSIEVRGKACASDESWLKDLTVQQERSGDRVRVTATRDRDFHFSGLGSNYAYLKLEIRLPPELLVEVDAGSGDADVSHVAALNFGAGSGDLKANHIAGDVTVKVGSGDIVIDDLGNLSIERVGSGDVRASQVRGEVKVGHVGSGDLRLKDIKGGVHVEAIGSGDLVVDRAGGDVVVGSVGSGDVTVDGVGGNFIVHSAGSGDLHHHNVTGKVEVPSRHAFD